MVEASGELGVDQPRAEVVKKLEVGGRELVVLKASPRTREQPKSPDVLYVEGHNPKPKKDDDQVKTGYDISILADSMGCDVYSIVRSGEGTDSAKVAQQAEDREGVTITQIHQAKANEILGAIEALQEEGKLSREQLLDVMGFSDGGIVTLAMLNARPELFRRFVTVNTPGLDNSGVGRSYAQGFKEIAHLGAHRLLETLRKGKSRVSQSRLTFQRSTDDDYAESSYRSKPHIETHAVAKTRGLARLLPHILERNQYLHGYIMSTENDKIAPAERIEKVLTDILPGEEQRVQAKATGWKTHTMGYGAQEREEKLTDIGGFMTELREQTNP